MVPELIFRVCTYESKVIADARAMQALHAGSRSAQSNKTSLQAEAYNNDSISEPPSFTCLHQRISFSSAGVPRAYIIMFTQLTLAAKPHAVASRRVNTYASAETYSRRQLYGMAAAVAPFMSAGAASALLAYDDDEEMVEKAKANRSKRLKEVGLE